MTHPDPTCDALWLELESDLLSIPAEVAYEIAATGDPKRVKEILCAALDEVFDRFHAAAQLARLTGDGIVH